MRIFWQGQRMTDKRSTQNAPAQRIYPRKVKKFEVIETTCNLGLPNSADDVTLRMICFLS